MVVEIANKIDASIEPRRVEETLVWLNIVIFKFLSRYIILWKGVLGINARLLVIRKEKTESKKAISDVGTVLSNKTSIQSTRKRKNNDDILSITLTVLTSVNESIETISIDIMPI